MTLMPLHSILLEETVQDEGSQTAMTLAEATDGRTAAPSVFNNVRWAFFDLDGTLADSITGLRSSIAWAFQAVGKPMPTSDLRQWIGPGIRTILHNMEPTLTENDLDSMERSFRTHYDSEGILQTQMFDDVAPVLQAMRQNGCHLFVVTNKPKLATAVLLRAQRLSHLFEAVVSRNSREPAYASKGEMLAETVRAHAADVAQSVMIGDTEEDAEAAAHLGMRFIHAAYGYGQCKDKAHPRLENFGALLPFCGMHHLTATSQENDSE